jgi:2-oxoglutarate ferredoxin oxidoreductase subunit gamma
MTGRGTSQVLIGGEAGQGVILQGIILADAAVAGGAWVAQTARYGAAMRGGEATAGVVISALPIDFPYVEQADYLVLLSQQTYAKYATGAGQLVVYDPFFVTPEAREGIDQVGIPATDTALKDLGGAQPANLIVVGALAALTGLVTTDNLIEAVDRNLSARFRATNIRALEIGAALARAAREGA